MVIAGHDTGLRGSNRYLSHEPYSLQPAIRAPISHFAFQQLADDDSYAYLWIAFGDCQISTLLET